MKDGGRRVAQKVVEVGEGIGDQKVVEGVVVEERWLWKKGGRRELTGVLVKKGVGGWAEGVVVERWWKRDERDWWSRGG